MQKKQYYSVQRRGGDDDIESDIDLLVITAELVTWNERKTIDNALYKIELKYDLIISILITSVLKWTEGTFSVLPIYHEILTQGVIA